MSDGIRQALISSLFPPSKMKKTHAWGIHLSPPHVGSQEKLIVHVKTYKDIQSSETSKDIKGTPRYLCLTRNYKASWSKYNIVANVSVDLIEKKSAIRLLKVKRNQNGTFSISKAWSLDDIKQIQIVDVGSLA